MMKFFALVMTFLMVMVQSSSVPEQDPRESIEKNLIPKIPIPILNYHYVELGKKVNFFQASQYCLDNFGTTLATVADEFDLAEIFNLWSYKGYKNMWIGLNALESHATEKELDSGYGWEWASGVPYTNTYFRESKKSKNEKCVIFRNADKNKVWHNERCSRKFPAFACDRY